MADTSNEAIKERDKFYYRQRNKNRVFEKLVMQFAEEAERTGITKKQLAERLKADPAQITRWLSAPGNLTLDSVSDLLLALGAEMDYRVSKFSDRQKANYMHDLVSQVLHMKGSRVGSFEISNPKSGTLAETPGKEITASSGESPIKILSVSSV